MATDETQIGNWTVRWIGDRKVELLDYDADARVSFAGDETMDRNTILARALERAYGQAEGTATVGLPGEVHTTEDGHIIIGVPVATMKGQGKYPAAKTE